MNAEPAPLSFENTSTAFAYKTDDALRRSALLFRSIQWNFLVSIGPTMVKWALAVGMPIKGLLRTYFFNQFCGGVTLEETAAQTELLGRYKVKSVMDYAVEALKSETGYQRAQDELIRLIDHAKAHGEISHIALKMSAMGSLELMQKLQAGQQLAGTEKVQYDRMVVRLEHICAYAEAAGQAVLIDAEESWIQNEIDRLAEGMIRKHNRTRAVVYTTAQLYRHDRLAYVQAKIDEAKADGYVFGVKLVRGAYLEKENDRAKEKGYPTPMQPNKAATDHDYNAAAALCLANLDHTAMYAGTHNEESCLFIAQKMQVLGLAPQNERVWFGQLFGMSDHISFNLAEAGYNVGKYLPYGPLEQVLPYLFRRAEENTSIAGQSPRELQLIEQELKSRQEKKRLATVVVHPA